MLKCSLHLQDSIFWSSIACFWMKYMKAIQFVCTSNAKTYCSRWLTISECSIVENFLSTSATRCAWIRENLIRSDALLRNHVRKRQRVMICKQNLLKMHATQARNQGRGHLPPPEIFKTLHSNFDICRNFQRIKMKFYILIIFMKSYWSFSLACSLIISLPNLS